MSRIRRLQKSIRFGGDQCAIRLDGDRCAIQDAKHSRHQPRIRR